MTYPEEHFPGTPRWVQDAIAEAIYRTDVSLAKWQVPLEAMGRFESNYNPGANLCSKVEGEPVGLMQQGRNFYLDAKNQDPIAHFGLGTIADPVRSFVMAIMHIDSRLTVSGGYGGMGQLDGKSGLLPRTDRGPGNVLREWIRDPSLNFEQLREFYRGY